MILSRTSIAAFDGSVLRNQSFAATLVPLCSDYYTVKAEL